MENDRPQHWRLATRLVRGGTDRSSFDETCEAIFMTSGFVYDSAEQAARTFRGEIDHFQYSRFGNPTLRMFEERLASIEGAKRCRSTATGMAAVFASMACFLRAGDRIVASRALFGSCHYIVAEIMPGFGITADFIDGTDLADWRRALSRPAQAVFLESPSNPMLDIVDIAAVSELAHAAGARVIVDNVFATPLLQRPLALGADIVVYSATKHIDGQGRCLGGAILTDDDVWFDTTLIPFTRNTGPSLSPFNAWLLLKGLETLDLRVRRSCDSALAIARYLEQRNDLAQVYYPALSSHRQHALASRQMAAGGTIVTFDLPGGQEEAFAWLDGLRLIDISNNLGDAKTLVTHPATTTHQRLTAEERARLGIGEGTVRISVGLEDVADLTEDLAQAFDRLPR
jgi:O-succinylhomoserine sulfhydrylase